MNYESTAEAATLMHVTNCMMTASENKNIVGLVYNSIVGCYLMTADNAVGVNQNGEVYDVESPMMVEAETFMNCIANITHTVQLGTLIERAADFGMIEIPQGLTVKSSFLEFMRAGVTQFPGRLLFSALLPEDFYYEKGKVLIINGILVKGTITRDHIAPYVHRSIIQMIHARYRSERTANFITDARFVTKFFLNDFGYSIGIADCKFKDEKDQELITKQILTVKAEIEALGDPIQDPIQEAARQQQINVKLSNIKAYGLTLAKKVFQGGNNIGIAISELGSGAKGSTFHVAQTIGSLGQQFYKGKRIQRALTNATRTLPHFRGTEEIEEQGFIKSSFVQGMTPTEMFFHLYAGREGLTDTANNTAQSGAMHHNIVKALENFSVSHTGAVVNKIGTVFQPVYGGDGFAAEELINVPYGDTSIASFWDPSSAAGNLNAKFGWVPEKAFK